MGESALFIKPEHEALGRSLCASLREYIGSDNFGSGKIGFFIKCTLAHAIFTFVWLGVLYLFFICVMICLALKKGQSKTQIVSETMRQIWESLHSKLNNM